MAKGQDLSKFQRGVVNRYYQNRDTIAVNALTEIVSELYLCESDKAAQRLWKRAETHLPKAGAAPEAAASVLASKDIEQLAKLVSSLS